MLAAPTITVIWVNWRSLRYIAPLYDQLLEKAEHPERLEFLIVDNTNGTDPEIAAFADERCIHLVANAPGELTGSWAHSHGLNQGMGLVQTPYTLVLDPDVAIFKAGWDNLLLGLVEPPGVVAAGAPYPFWKLGKYHDFPSPIFCFFDTDTIRGLGQTWVPFADSPLLRGWHRFLRQFVRLFGLATRGNLIRFPWMRSLTVWLERTLGVCGPDTGWRIAEALRAEGMTSVLFQEEFATSGAMGEHPALKQLVETFEVFSWREEPIIAHKYSTRARLWRTRESHDVGLWERLVREAAE